MYRLIHTALLFWAIALSVHLASAQSYREKGVRFEDKLSWPAIKMKAAIENKYIFVDCYATWCGPCKYMSYTIFPQQTAGDFFNSRFINVRIQMDTTAKDDEVVKKWYADAHRIKAQYGVQAFPTFLIFAPDGRIVDKIVGGENTATKFIAIVRRSFDPSEQYYTQLLDFMGGRRDSSFLRRMAYQCLEVSDMPNGIAAWQAWQGTQRNPYTPTGLDLLKDYTKHISDPGFALLYQHSAEADKVMGPGWAERLVKYILFRDYVAPQLSQNSDPDWPGMQQLLASKYPVEAEEVVALSKVLFYQFVKEWPEFQAAILAYMQKYGEHATPEELNSYAVRVFQNCRDMSCVAGALDWSKRSFKDKPNPLYMDTYANILYKMGKRTEAITWEQKALALSTADDRPSLRSNLEKMQKGEKTWNDQELPN